MTDNKNRMGNVKIGKDTLEMMGMIGALHDLIEQYVAIYERLYPEICGGNGIPDSTYDEVCTAFSPAISFMEDEVHKRLTDFMISLDGTEI